MNNEQNQNTRRKPKKKRKKRRDKAEQEWTFFYANCRGINSKKKCLIEILGELKPQIALFAETKHSGNIGFKIDGYSFCGKGGKTKNSGGVGMLVRDDLIHIITPHEPSNDLDMFWVSIQRPSKRPIYCAIYYGKQEGNSNEQIRQEMDKLSEEILDKRNEGEVIIFTDGNAKINILNEGISRNGKMLLEVINECELDTLNLSDKCTGKITRVNRSNINEKSAFDFILSSSEITHNIESMLIDEDENFLLTGKAPTDHNSIILKVNIEKISKREKLPKVVKWQLSAPDELWADFEKKLRMTKSESSQIINNPENDFDKNYDIWTRRVEKIALETIGKTTYNPNTKNQESTELRELRVEKKTAKRDFEKETDSTLKGQKLNHYYQKQDELKQLITKEDEENVRKKFEKMMSHENGFWDACKRQKSDPLNSWTAVKDDSGQRILDPESQKNTIANLVKTCIAQTQVCRIMNITQ